MGKHLGRTGSGQFQVAYYVDICVAVMFKVSIVSLFEQQFRQQTCMKRSEQRHNMISVPTVAQVGL
jgi:hypothetical protein